MSGEEMNRLEAGLKALAAEMRQVDAPERVEQRLREAFRAGQGRAAKAGKGWWTTIAAWTGAAAACAAMAVFLVRDRAPVPVHQPSHSPLQLAEDAAFDSDLLTAEDSGFIPLPNAESFSPTEEVDVVRVEVPRSAIATLGFPVSEEQAGETVTADIALGSDGLARAIRILGDKGD